MAQSDLIKDLSPEKREQIYLQDRRIELAKWFIVSVALVLLSSVVAWQFKNREVQIEEQRLSHQINLESQRAQREYLTEFIEFALERDIDARIRFAHYFATLTEDTQIGRNWSKYYDDLLDAKRSTEEEDSQDLRPDQRIGGNEPIAGAALDGERTFSRVVLVPTMDRPVEFHRSLQTATTTLSDVGFHFIVRQNGEIEEGRPTNISPAVVSGFNTGTLGIALGCSERFDHRSTECPVTEAQHNALVSLLVANLMERSLSPEIPIHEANAMRNITRSGYPEYLKEYISRVRSDVIRAFAQIHVERLQSELTRRFEEVPQ